MRSSSSPVCSAGQASSPQGRSSVGASGTSPVASKCPPSSTISIAENPSSSTQPTTLTPTQRRELVLLLTEFDLSDGKGTSKQQRAYQELEWRRCQSSFVYFIEHHGYLKLKSGSIIKWDDIWPVQRKWAGWWEAGESTDGVKCRQNGGTTTAAHFALWDAMSHEAVTWNIVGKDKDSSADVIERLRATIDRLPAWMLDRARATTRSEAGKASKQDSGESVFSLGFGLSRIHALTSTPKKTQGRAGKVILDDFGAHEEQERKWQLLYPTLDDPDPTARGQVIIIFNGNGEDFASQLYEKAKTAEVPLRAHFEWWGTDYRRLEGAWIDGAGGLRIPADGMTYEAMYAAYKADTFHSPWYERTRSAYLISSPEADAFAFKAQFPWDEREAFVLSGNSRFNLTTLNEHQTLIAKDRAENGEPYPRVGIMSRSTDKDGVPAYGFEENGRGFGRLYLEPEPDALYILATDAAGGRQSSDYCVSMVCKVHPNGAVEQAFVYQAKVEPADELAYESICLAHWYNDALMIPETGSSGHGKAFVDVVKQEYSNIYQEMRTSRLIDQFREELGFSTNTSTRRPLIDGIAAGLGRLEAGEWVIEPTVILHDQPTLDELVKFQLNVKTGRAEAPKGGHDDLVMALGLCIVGSRSTMYFDQEPVTFSPMDW